MLLMRFLEERVARIQSDEAAKKIKSPVAYSVNMKDDDDSVVVG